MRYEAHTHTIRNCLFCMLEAYQMGVEWTGHAFDAVSNKLDTTHHLKTTSHTL